METPPYKLCEEVLARLHSAGVLDGLVVAGSWCLYFYQDYFSQKDFTPTIRTRDLDFAVPIPSRFKSKTDLTELFDDLGFVTDYRGTQGYVRLMHPELILEFLVPERGRGSDSAFDIPELGVNAQRLRFLDLSLTDTITVEHNGIPLRLPHPVRFALHKLIVAERRGSDKAINDRRQAIMVLEAIRSTEESDLIRQVFDSLPEGWKRTILTSLNKSGLHDAETLLGLA